MDEGIFVRLRDCFSAGYTLPQYCVDNGIKKPLFVSEKKYEQLLWEIHVQFRYDKRILASFCFIDAPTDDVKNFASFSILTALQIENISEINPSYFDATILFTTQKVNVKGRVIPIGALASYFSRKTYDVIPTLHFLQRYPGVKLFLTNFPTPARYEGGSEFNLQLPDGAVILKKIREGKGTHIETPFDKFGYTNDDVKILLKLPDIQENLDGSTMISDDNHPLVRIKNNKRTTAYQPEKFLNKIYIFGTCHHYGVNAPFDKTIESYLQQMLNENNLSYRVENEGQIYFGRYQDIFYNLNKITPKPGDIIFLFLQHYFELPESGFPFFDVSDAFDPPYDYKEVYCTKGHVNELGYKALAEKYFDFLTANNFFRDKEFNYPLPPPPLRTATASRRNTNGETRLPSKMRSWTLTSRRYGRRKFQSAQSS